MRIVLIRHGSKKLDPKTEDKDLPLSKEGREEASQLGSDLAIMDLKPEIFLTSRYEHAREMGDILAKQFNDPPAKIYSCEALTPHSRTHTFEHILDEAKSAGIDLRKAKDIIIVGHEARLSQLSTRLTSARSRPFNRSEAVSITAPTLLDLLRGKGKIEFRVPMVDYQEDKLRPKIQSKMTVSTFLAGFTFSVLVGLLLQTNVNLTLLKSVAVILMMASLGLFIASVYMYDRMSMPEGFWVYGERARRRPWGKTFEVDRQRDGPLYAYMVWAWNYAFTPAVFLGLLGFLAILVETQNIVLIALGFVVIIGVIIYYLITRPRLGTD